MLTRRRLLRSGAAAGLAWSWPVHASTPPAPFPVHFRKLNPYESLRNLVEPGHDEFTVEKDAAAATARWNRLLSTGAVPMAGGFQRSTPMPARYKEVAPNIFSAEFDRTDTGFEAGMGHWIAKLGALRSARFFVLADDRLRYEIAGTVEGSLQYRVGIWKQAWRGAQLAEFEPLEETLVTAPLPLFRDVTRELFGPTESFARPHTWQTPLKRRWGQNLQAETTWD